eukprot:TRINITY_DN254_c1_g1_i5.p1 TRINITY_DN254_c1_g1~~TRINITY_DN254_c1_g1_i5.p1  ORF type:complete len:1130 (+),score=377.24 TRINITY_DN254_c1_g1_i5:116-3391(+)
MREALRKQDGTLTDVLILVSPGTLVTIDGTSVAKLNDPKHHEPTSDDALLRSSDTPSAEAFPQTQSVNPTYQKEGIPCYIHKLKGDGPEAAFKDMTPVGSIRGSALDVFKTTQTRWVLTVGRSPSVAAFDTTFETASASHIAKDAAKKAFNMMKSTFSSRLWGTEAQEAETPIVLPKSIKVDPSFKWDDSERNIDTVTPDSTGRYVAITDARGRVTIMDARMFVVVKMLKGYRDASVMWLHEARHAERATGTFLVHLPHRGIVEAWMVSRPKRLAAIKVGFDCTMVRAVGGEACKLLYSDGMLASLKLDFQFDDDDADAEEVSAQEAQSAHMKTWMDLCRGSPTLEALLGVLNKIQSPIDILECVTVMPVTLDHSLWRDVNIAALSLLEQRGVDCEDSEASEVLVTEVASEHARLCGPNAPHLSQGDVFRYLVNRLAVINAYTLLVTLKTKGIDRAGIPSAWAEEIATLNTTADPLAPPSDLLLKADQPDHISLSPVLPLHAFLAYFNLFGRSVSLVQLDAKLSEFMCNPLQHSCDTLSRCAHILSLSNDDMLRLLLQWGTTPRGMNIFVPIDSLGRLLTAPFCDAMDERLPKWLLHLRSKDELFHCGFLIVAGRKRLKEQAADDYKIEMLEGWLSNLLALIQLRSILPQLEWVKSLSLITMTGVSPAAVAAAATVDTGLDDHPKLAQYIDKRDSREAYHAHKAMMAVFVHLKTQWAHYKVKGQCVTDSWVDIASEIHSSHSKLDVQEVKEHISQSGAWLRATAYWCAVAMLVPIKSLVEVGRMRNSSVARACRELGKSHAAIHAHCEATRSLLALLVNEHEDEIPCYSKEWWRITPYEAMLTTTLMDISGQDVHKEEADRLLRFISLALADDMVVYEPFTDTSAMQWNELFAKDAVELLAENKGSEAASKQFISSVVDKIDTKEMMGVGTKLCEALGVGDEHFTVSAVAFRLHLEGQDTKAAEVIGATPIDSATYLPFLTRVVRLRLKHILSCPVAGGFTQKRTERSLNLVSGLPLELVEWVNDVDTTPEEEALIQRCIATVPMPTLCHRLKTLIYRVLQHPDRNAVFDKPTLLKLQESQNFAVYLLKNV